MYILDNDYSLLNKKNSKLVCCIDYNKTLSKQAIEI